MPKQMKGSKKSKSGLTARLANKRLPIGQIAMFDALSARDRYYRICGNCGAFNFNDDVKNWCRCIHKVSADTAAVVYLKDIK